MNNLIAGLQLLQNYVKVINQNKALTAVDETLFVAPTDRLMTYNDVRALKSLGWTQKALPSDSDEYDVNKPWRFLTA